MKIKLFLAMASAALLMASLPVESKEKEEKAAEEDLEVVVEHLLDFVRTSDVIFIRNNKEHPPEKAAKHIEKKYKHYRKKIKTPEDFIEYSATKSMMSGKPYQVRMKDGTVIATKDWLTAELERYRSGEKEAKPDSTVEGKECESDSI
jgi:hypothetical protein